MQGVWKVTYDYGRNYSPNLENINILDDNETICVVAPNISDAVHKAQNVIFDKHGYYTIIGVELIQVVE